MINSDLEYFDKVFKENRPNLNNINKVNDFQRTFRQFDKAINVASGKLRVIERKIIKNCDVPWYNYELFKIHNEQMKIIRKLSKLKRRNMVNENVTNLNQRLNELDKKYKR